ncbi:transcription initiation factor tfiid subunit [Grosmannia clavigera kw1407]|uniref:Transcription initiation factor tfiid subunit n=1 Tax=Grosmannia clavigera (strain kw1407 / UAMH 11150) TaxID=655863 RepID=F0XDA9_GROCL|nr:transcription initiation factor tfiid subunit [Grosmannia clavigera kw1407]EFX03694.1 transcription initiation factor tfiid subunit [Grosmannia clavigera kw1407]
MASPPLPPAKPSRPVTLKLKPPGSFSNSSNARPSSISSLPLVGTPTAMSPPPVSAGGTKIILKRSQPSTPAAVSDRASSFSGATATPNVARTPASAFPSSMTMTQKGRVSKPTAKKRARDLDDSEDENKPESTTAGPPKRPKLIVRKSMKPKPASIVLKQIPKEIPPHSRGEGYDSEEEDREPDPTIEEEFVLRMLPGEHCDYLRRMTEERKIGVPVKEGGADFQMKWLPGVERRALVTVNGTRFVGVLVDLPTITEGMKTWDKRNFMKSADICQMLLVFATVADDAEAKSLPLPAMVTKDYRWPHGLTPPMHDCIHRRFRKRLSKKEIKDKEAELQRLLNEDRIAVETKWELIDDGRAATATTTTAGAGGAGAGGEFDDGEMEEGEEDAYGEVDEDYFGQHQDSAAPDIDDAELEAMFMEEDGDGDTAAAAETPTTQTAATGAGKPSGGNGAAGAESEASDADADEDDDEEDDDDDDDMDEDQLAQAEQVKGVREDINELKKQLQLLDKNLAATQNMLLRKRIEENKKRVMSELRLKQASIGEVDEEE